jgi:hypothetical protein
MRIFVLSANYELRVSIKSHLHDHPNSYQEIGDENGDDSVFVSTYSQSKCNTNPNPDKPIDLLLLRIVTEDSKSQNRCSKA